MDEETMKAIKENENSGDPWIPLFLMLAAFSFPKATSLDTEVAELKGKVEVLEKLALTNFVKGD